MNIDSEGDLQVSRVGLLGEEHTADEDTCNMLVLDHLVEEIDPYDQVQTKFELFNIPSRYPDSSCTVDATTVASVTLSSSQYT